MAYEPVLGRDLQHEHDYIPSATTKINVSAAAAPSAGQVLTATDSKHANWQSPSGGGVAWGTITGTLSNQTDLQSALNAKQNSLGFTPEDVANKSTNTSLGSSDTLYPSQKAVKTYVDAHAGTPWTKVHKAYSDFSVASHDSTINLMAIAAGTIIEDIIIYVNTSFDDGAGHTAGLSQMGIDIGSGNELLYIGDTNIKFGAGNGVTSVLQGDPAQLLPDSVVSTDVGQVYSLLAQIDGNKQLKLHGSFVYDLTTAVNINMTIYAPVNLNTFIAGDLYVYIKTRVLP